MVFNGVEMAIIRRVFHRSMLYVAVTRVRDAQHLTLIGAPRDWRRYDREAKKAELDAHQAQIEELIAEEKPEE